MKKIIFPILAAVLLLIGCKKANELTKFDISYETTVVIPSATNINLPFDISTPDIETNHQSKFEINRTSKDRIESIELSKLKLTVKTPDGNDFSFLKSIEIYIDGDNLSEEKIAWKDPVPNSTGTSITLDVSGTDLKPYILNENFNLRVRSVTDEVITADHEIEIKSTFTVDAKIL